MRDIRIVHIIDRLGSGGAARVALTHARDSQNSDDFKHHIVSLLPAEPPILALAREAGIAVTSRPEKKDIPALLESADIVHIHFFNSPALYDFLSTALPAARKLLWLHIAGSTAPQILPSCVVARMDRVIVTTPRSLDLESLRNPENLPVRPNVIIGGADFSRLAGFKPRKHDGYNVGYIGTIDLVKMHPRFVEMSADIEIPGIRFIVCGNGTGLLKRKIAALGASEKFDLRGYVEDIRQVLETIDVFGYPLCADNYSTTDQTLQEAMFAGIPPVIFDHGATQSAVQHNRTGLVVSSEEEYRNAIRYLGEHASERQRLGDNAHEFASRSFGATRTVPLLNEAYRALMAEPKHSWIPLPVSRSSGLTGAELFVLSLGDQAADFAISMNANEEAQRAADRRIANSPTLMASPQSGGIPHYRAYFPKNPFLRMWAGLVLAESGQHVRALIEYKAALEAGGDAKRLASYIRAAATAMGASEAAIRSATAMAPDA